MMSTRLESTLPEQSSGTMSAKKRIVVAGGNGFLGTYFALPSQSVEHTTD